MFAVNGISGFAPLLGHARGSGRTPLTGLPALLSYDIRDGEAASDELVRLARAGDVVRPLRTAAALLTEPLNHPRRLRAHPHARRVRDAAVSAVCRLGARAWTPYADALSDTLRVPAFAAGLSAREHQRLRAMHAAGLRLWLTGGDAEIPEPGIPWPPPRTAAPRRLDAVDDADLADLALLNSTRVWLRTWAYVMASRGRTDTAVNLRALLGDDAYQQARETLRVHDRTRPVDVQLAGWSTYEWTVLISGALRGAAPESRLPDVHARTAELIHQVVASEVPF